MKLQYLGTAASEGIPAIFCRCEKCRTAAEKGGRNIRTRSQALVDGRILIDFPADTFWHGIKYGIDFSEIRTLLITHTHCDHFYPAEFENRERGLSNLTGGKNMTVYGSSDIESFLEMFTHSEKPYGITLRIVNAFETFETEEGYNVTPLKANHGTENPYIYLIEHNGKSLLYGHDTGELRADTYSYLLEKKVRLDMISIDCTEGTKKIDYDAHMNVDRCILLKNRMLEDGITDENTTFVLNHFSHNGGNCLYDEIVPAVAGSGMRVSYDGMTVEF